MEKTKLKYHLHHIEKIDIKYSLYSKEKIPCTLIQYYGHHNINSTYHYCYKQEIIQKENGKLET